MVCNRESTRTIPVGSQRGVPISFREVAARIEAWVGAGPQAGPAVLIVDMSWGLETTRRRRITVNAIAPGFTLTEASLGMMENATEYGVARGALKRAAGP